MFLFLSLWLIVSYLWNKINIIVEFIQRNHMCISMELVTAVLGDHGQRPREDYGKQYKE